MVSYIYIDPCIVILLQRGLGLVWRYRALAAQFGIKVLGNWRRTTGFIARSFRSRDLLMLLNLLLLMLLRARIYCVRYNNVDRH